MRAKYLLKESTGLVFLVNHIWRDRLARVSGCSAHIQGISYVDAGMRAQAFVFRKSTQVCAGLMCIPANMDTLVCMHSFAQALHPILAHTLVCIIVLYYVVILIYGQEPRRDARL
jgi:hypothetical protein